MSELIRIAPSPSLFGFGTLSKLPGELSARNLRRILIITDPQISANGILDQVLTLLKGPFEIKRFEEVPAEPHSTDVDGQKEKFGSDFDALLAVGGGSSMDFAKALSLLMTHGGSLGDYVGEGLVPGPVLPVVCVPTTSGTGSQNTQTTVYTIGGVKMGCSSEFIRPVFSVVDPELTMSLPPVVTRNTGYDALMHAVESFIACPSEKVPDRPILYQGSNPFSQGIAIEAFRLIWKYYRQAVLDGSDREARMGMSIGSHLAGLAFSHSGLGLVHALASSLGGMIDAPHGVCLAACTNIGLSYNFEACDKELATLETVMRLGDGKGSADRFLSNIQTLIEDLGFPLRPSGLGVKKGDAQIILEKTLIQTRRIQTNPRQLDESLLSFIEEGI
ncbi:MAG TPA: iron-containing alcohol dehydrogenase [Thermodesulfobacteriota bacterium]|nr:iron-containing alcohol dehydrogenase [Thermodesulfobacteriota bacterium]